MTMMKRMASHVRCDGCREASVCQADDTLPRGWGQMRYAPLGSETFDRHLCPDCYSRLASFCWENYPTAAVGYFPEPKTMGAVDR